MASLIPGYEYDIFISYRQKDNKHDGWVTEFVNNLKGELESTFKEEISVYFDTNPHDGLLETHDVYASLKDKLKCLIFIPIISRTYCDPKSFAWEHEFKSFVEQASKDQIGLKVKLLNGNVTSRVLPVRIYDLDNADIKLFESVFGGVLRSVEFIYKSAGVNRPLMSKEENPQDNLNHTNYRDQINKVANAIKEIIAGIVQYIPQREEVSKEILMPKIVPRKNRKIKIIAGSIIALALIVLGYFFISKLIVPNNQVDKSIAVLPFANDSPDKENEYFCNGMMDEILTQIQQISDLKVKSRTSVEKYRNTDKDIKVIGKELGVTLIMEGSVRKIGDDLRITAQLIDTKSGDHLWAETYDGKYTTKIFEFQGNVAKKVASSMNAVITPQEAKRIDLKPTSEMLAHDLYLKGSEMVNKWHYTDDSLYIKLAVNSFTQALKIDPKYIAALDGIKMIYQESGSFDSAMFYLDKIEAIDPGNTSFFHGKGAIYYYTNKPDSALFYLQKAINIEPNNPWLYLMMGQVFFMLRDDVVKGFPYYQKAFKLGRTIKEINQNLAMVYFFIEDYPKVLKCINNALSVSPEQLFIINYSYVLSAQGKYNEAFHFLDSICNINDCGQKSDVMKFHFYTVLKEYEKAETYCNKAIRTGYTLTEDDNIYLACLYKETGRIKEASTIVKNLIRRDEDLLRSTPHRYVIRTLKLQLAAAYAIMDDKRNTLKYLPEGGNKELTKALLSPKTFPAFDNLRNDSEFKAILKRIEDDKASLREQVQEMEQRGETELLFIMNSYH
jgi:TolB-like protein